jgi:hypothetical protein
MARASPIPRLAPHHQPGGAAVRLEHRGLAFLDVEPVLAERIHDVGLVADDHGVAAGRRSGGGELAQRLRPAIVFDRRHHEAALADVGARRDFAEAEQLAGLDRSIEHAGEDLAHRNVELAHRLADGARQHAPIVVELALLGDIGEVERIGVGLILVGGAVPEHDHVSALPQRIDPFCLGGRALTVGRHRPPRHRHHHHRNFHRMHEHCRLPFRLTSSAVVSGQSDFADRKTEFPYVCDLESRSR